MAKKVILSDATNEQLVEELSKRLNAAASDSSSEESFPSVDAIEKMDSDELTELAEKASIETDGKDEDDLRALLVTLAKVGSDDTEDLEADAVKDLCTALGVKPGKKLEANIEAIKALFADDAGGEAEAEDKSEEAEESESEDESEEEESEEESEEEAEEEESEEEEAEEEDSDDDDGDEKEEEGEEEEAEEEESEEEEAEEEAEEVDPAEVVKKKLKYPAEGDMKKRLDAFNKVAGKKAIDIKKAGGVKKAYAKLAELLVDSEGNLAAWGKPYVKDGSGYCCGLSMKDTKFKGDKNEYGKCLVTSKVFSVDDEGNWVQKED